LHRLLGQGWALGKGQRGQDKPEDDRIHRGPAIFRCGIKPLRRSRATNGKSNAQISHRQRLIRDDEAGSITR
jgi:hypothetical protein